MSDNRPNDAHFEGTQFYRQSAVREIIRIVLITVVVFSLVSVLAFWAAIDVGGRQAFKEARDIRRALRAVGTEYYGDMSSIYDPNSSTGLAEGAAERIRDLSQRSGTVILYDWDDMNKTPISFEYRKGLYRVVYADSGVRDNAYAGTVGDFEVYYSFEVFKFESE